MSTYEAENCEGERFRARMNGKEPESVLYAISRNTDPKRKVITENDISNLVKDLEKTNSVTEFLFKQDYGRYMY